jgi:hypothetical protein
MLAGLSGPELLKVWTVTLEPDLFHTWNARSAHQQSRFNGIQTMIAIAIFKISEPGSKRSEVVFTGLTNTDTPTSDAQRSSVCPWSNLID